MNITNYFLACVLSLQLCPSLCNPMDCSQPGSSLHGILQSRILEWISMPSSRGSYQPRVWTQLFFFFFCIAPGGSNGRESTCNVGDLGLIPGLGRSPGEGNSYPLQYSGLENSMDCIAQGVTKSRTRLSNFTISQKNFLEVELPGTSAFLKLLLPGATNLILMVQTQIFTTEDPLVSRTPPWGTW